MGIYSFEQRQFSHTNQTLAVDIRAAAKYAFGMHTLDMDAHATRLEAREQSAEQAATDPAAQVI